MPVTETPPAYSANNEKACFFIEQAGFTQDASQSFGPVAGNQVNAFRITSKFSCGVPQKAYAICKGIVLVQPQTGNADKVNLILRPYTQPFPGLNIKYFVYRGLRRSDFFTAGSAPEVILAAGSATSDFINKINADFDSFYADALYDATGTEILKPVFAAKYMGYDPLEPDATLISDLFFKESQFTTAGTIITESQAYELPLMSEGKWLGYFDAGECGIDVVLNYGDYKHDFDNSEFVFDAAYARAPEAAIVLTGTDSNKKLQREQTIQFIDIAAFYGLFAASGKVTAFSSNTPTEKAGTAIYTELLAPFATKNNWYLYIQGDRTRSYNYYGKYIIADGNPNDLVTGIAENALTETQYGLYGWPLFINAQPQPIADGKNRLYLQLVTDNNINTVLYGQTGIIENAQQNNFCNVEDLRLPPDASGNYSRLTKVLKLNAPAAADGNNIATLTILLYQGVVYDYIAGQMLDDTGQPVDVYAQPNFFDDVFDLVKAQPLLKSDAPDGYAVMTSEKLKLVNHYYDRKQQGVSAVQTLAINDVIETGDAANPLLQRVTYITDAVDIMNNVVSVTGATTPDTKTTRPAIKAVGESKTYVLPEPYYYDIEYFTDSTNTVTGLTLQTLDGSETGKIILGLTREENDLLKGLITAGRKNPRIFLIDLFADGNELISLEKTIYQKYKIGIVAEENNILSLFMPPSDIIAYALDRKYHFSKGYSEFVKEYQAFNHTINRSL